MISPVSLSLRLVGPNSQLDAAERAAMFTFLTTNRVVWNHASSPGGPPSTPDGARASIEQALERHPGPYWNAFVRTLCIEVWASGSTRVFVPIVNMSAICLAAPKTLQASFAQTFINVTSSDCGSAAGQFKTLFGIGSNGAATNWAAAALNTGAPPQTPYYAPPGRNGAGPVALDGAPKIDSVRPFAPSPPGWTLREWEIAGVCHTPAGIPAKIIGLRFKGGAQTLDILDNSADATIRIETDPSGLKEQLNLDAYKGFRAPTLARADLNRLTVEDVDDLDWAAPGADGGSERIGPRGCVRTH